MQATYFVESHIYELIGQLLKEEELLEYSVVIREISPEKAREKALMEFKDYLGTEGDDYPFLIKKRFREIVDKEALNFAFTDILVTPLKVYKITQQ